MRPRSLIAGCILLILATLSVRETRCGSECQAAAALFAAKSASIQKAQAMPGMEDCPMARLDAKGPSITTPDTCSKRMVHAQDEAQTEEQTHAPEFRLAPITLASLTSIASPSHLFERDPDPSPPGRTQASLRTNLRI